MKKIDCIIRRFYHILNVKNMIMEVICLRKKKLIVTELNEHDRKILNKYTKAYTNFIESNTSQNEVLKDESYDDKMRRV